MVPLLSTNLFSGVIVESEAVKIMSRGKASPHWVIAPESMLGVTSSNVPLFTCAHLDFKSPAFLRLQVVVE